jgi:hypothetical protein
MTREQELIIKASDEWIDAANTLSELHGLIQRTIVTPFHPAQELAEIYHYQMKPLYQLLAELYQMDMTVKMTFRLRRPQLILPEPPPQKTICTL